MPDFHMADEFVDAEAERSLIAAIGTAPALFWQVLDLLPVGTFALEAATWQAVTAAVEDGRQPEVPADWTLAEDAEAAARRLADLFQRRLLAGAQERLAQALYDFGRPAQDVAEMLEEEAARVQQAVRELRAGRLQWASELLDEVLREAAERQQQREETGKPAIGTPTGLGKLDEILSGWRPGLHLLAGGPGKGKTTLALQFALHAARDGIPAVYVTYENSPKSLVLKAICAQASLPASDVDKGFGDLAKLRQAAVVLRPVLGRLAILKGTQRLTVAQVRAKALSAMAKHAADRCFVVFDYLQQAAHGLGYDQIRSNVGKLAGELRDLSTRLDSPVLALSSQSRQGGNYGSGGGSANLDSLKESGDLEYAADTVMFLVDDDGTLTTPPTRAVKLVVQKNRHGETGAVSIIFRPDIGVMQEVERR